MNEIHMRKAYEIFKKGAEQMINSGVDPADVSAALVGAGAALSLDHEGTELTKKWLADISAKIAEGRPPVTSK
ncbi:MAG: hypothetical protein N0C86_06360 [Candidatus Thiodiazotropha taylori]|nr:hypothetical protein [Candidatus Thiodiazotropha taylori]MCW4325604.1 hypothetical protein [Candidatus Thiodiazotropha taylori]